LFAFYLLAYDNGGTILVYFIIVYKPGSGVFIYDLITARPAFSIGKLENVDSRGLGEEI
jgi:hypothetical protein